MSNLKLLECLFGHHDFFTSGCVRQCRRCKIVQLYSIPEWYTVELEDVEDFNLETPSRPRSFVETTSPGLSHTDKWLEHWSGGVTSEKEDPNDIIFYTRV